MSGFTCCFLTCIQVSQMAGKVVWYFHLFKNFPQFVVIHTVKGFGVANKAEVDIFLELSWFFYDPMDVGNLISGSSAFSKSSLNTWKFSVHILLKPHLENFEHYFASMWDECNCVVVWTFFGIAFLCNWNENGPFPVLWPMSFPNLLAYWVQHFNSIIFWIWNSSTGSPSPPLGLFEVMLLKAHLTLDSRMSGSGHLTWQMVSHNTINIILTIIIITIIIIIIVTLLFLLMVKQLLWWQKSCFENWRIRRDWRTNPI